MLYVISLFKSHNKRIWDGVLEKKLQRDGKPQQKNELDRRLHSISTELDEGNVKTRIRVAVGDDKVVDFTGSTYTRPPS